MKTKATKAKVSANAAKILKANPAGANEKVRAWILEVNPEEEALIGDFDKTITFKEVAERMLKGEDFYQMTKCEDSVHREICFRRLSAIYATDYDFWYYCWLSEGKALSRAEYDKIKEGK